MSRRTSRILIATFLALFALVVTAALGVWQYSRAYRADVEAKILNAKTIDLNVASTLSEYVPEKYYGQKVRLTGQLICNEKFKNIIPSQEISWNIAAVRLEDGSLIALASVEDLCLLEEVPQSWIGRIQPAQDFTQLSAIYQPPAVVDAINTDDLVARWKSDVRDGYVLVTKKVSQKLIVLPPVGIDIRNLFYAWQWWLFAGFTIFIYSRFVRDELHEKNANRIPPN
jgi:cytochrome oxidase assembly protein ShyY1